MGRQFVHRQLRQVLVYFALDASGQLAAQTGSQFAQRFGRRHQDQFIKGAFVIILN